MYKIKTMLLMIALTGGLSLAVVGNAHSDQERPATDNAVGSQLPPKLRALLVQEMVALLEASKQVMDALVRGQDDVVARNAQGMHDSFIMAQEMSEEDADALHEALSPAFIEKDQAFHELSAELAEAARKGDRDRQLELFSEMLSACVACHAQHATDRFPDLAGDD